MKKWQKAGMAVATLGGTLMMATPVFAAINPSVNLSAAGSAQWQNGSSASGSVIDQNSSSQVGQVSASNYYNNNVNNGFKGSQSTYVSNENGSSLVSTQNTSGGSSNSWTQAKNYTSQGASVSQGQSQIITNSGSDYGNGAKQGQVSGAISGTLNTNLTGGIAVNKQLQNGLGASEAALNQTSTIQAGNTTASGNYKSDTVVGNTVTNTNQYTGGVLVSSTSTTNLGGKTYTSAASISNPTAGFTQDQNQNIGLDETGGIQKQAGGALAGQVTNFWSLVPMGPNSSPNS